MAKQQQQGGMFEALDAQSKQQQPAMEVKTYHSPEPLSANANFHEVRMWCGMLYTAYEKLNGVIGGIDNAEQHGALLKDLQSSMTRVGQMASEIALLAQRITQLEANQRNMLHDLHMLQNSRKATPEEEAGAEEEERKMMQPRNFAERIEADQPLMGK